MRQDFESSSAKNALVVHRRFVSAIVETVVEREKTQRTWSFEPVLGTFELSNTCCKLQKDTITATALLEFDIIPRSFSEKLVVMMNHLDPMIGSHLMRYSSVVSLRLHTC